MIAKVGDGEFGEECENPEDPVRKALVRKHPKDVTFLEVQENYEP
jgi:hypothetical protein